MLFNSVAFLLFFPFVTLLYYVIPRKGKTLWLLLASYFFYMCWNAEYALLLLEDQNGLQIVLPGFVQSHTGSPHWNLMDGLNGVPPLVSLR